MTKVSLIRIILWGMGIPYERCGSLYQLYGPLKHGLKFTQIVEDPRIPLPILGT